MKEQAKICSKCRRSIISEERRGSLTSFLLSDLSCCCGQRNAPGGRLAGDSNAGICRRCGKVVPALSRPGSMTAFFFKDMRCQCKSPLVDGAGRSGDGLNKGAKGLPAGSLATRYGGGELLQKRTAARTAMRTRRAGAVEAAVLLAPGAVIGGCYKLVELAGQGGMGSIYRARHTVLGRQCAVKFLAPSMVSEQSWRMFQNEAKIISALQHHTICQVYDLGLHEGSLPYYAMDFIHGETLAETIDRQGPLSVGAALELFVKVCEGLSYAHRRGVVHKDLKPANIMLTVDGGDEIEVKILDFGISDLGEAWQSRREHSRAKAGTERVSAPDLSEVIGSAAYMSPEQFRGRDIDRRSDIYNLGCALFETLSGVPPFTGEGFEELEAAHRKAEPPSLHSVTGIRFPSGVEAILSKCLEKSPERRYQSVNELSIDMERVLAVKPLQFARDKESELLAAQLVGEKAASNRQAVLLVLGLTIAIVVPLTGVGALLYWMQLDRSLQLHGSGKTEQGDASSSSKVRLQDQLEPGLLTDIKKVPGSAGNEDEGNLGHATRGPMSSAYNELTASALKAMPAEITTVESFQDTLPIDTDKSSLDLLHKMKIAPGSFSSGIVKENGVAVRLFKFPGLHLLGTLTAIDDKGNLRSHVACDDVVEFPEQSLLIYRPPYFPPEVFEKVLAGFGKGDLFGLDLYAYSENVGELSKCLGIVAKTCSDLKYLKLTLSAVSTQPGANPRSRPASSLLALQQLRQLKTLSIVGRGDGLLVALPPLPQLESLRVYGLEDVSELIRLRAKPASRNRLVNLHISGANIAAGELKYFLELPGLQSLSIVDGKIVPGEIDRMVACRSRSLTDLAIQFDETSLPYFKPASIAGLTNLKDLRVLFSKRLWDSDPHACLFIVSSLRSEYPGLRVRYQTVQDGPDSIRGGD